MKYGERQVAEILGGFSGARLPTGTGCSLSEKRREILGDPKYENYLDEIAKKTEEYREKPIEATKFSEFRLFTLTGDRETYQRSYFDRRGRLAALALAVWLWQKPEDAAALEDAIWAVCDEYTWALPAHIWGEFDEENRPTLDLFAAETASALADICALNEELLSPAVTKRAREAVEKRVIERFLSEEFGWARLKNNWAAVCGGAVGIAALYLCKPEKAAKAVCKLQTAMESYISGFPDDGAGTEGVSYWAYGFTFFAAYAEMLCRLSGGKIDLFSDTRVKNIALFQQKAYFPFGGTVKFADCSEGDSSRWWGLCSYLKARYREAEFLPKPLLPSFDCDPCYRWVGIFRDIVWSAEPEPRRIDNKSYIFPNAEWLIASGKRSSGLAVKGGNNGENHNHNDVGQVEFYLNGDEVLIDYGGGVYDRDYFGEGRYERFECGSQGHSVPIIGGKYQKAGREFAAKNVKISELCFRTDISPAYGNENLASLVRTVNFDTKGGLELVDCIKFEGFPESVCERFVSFCEPTAEGGKILLKGKNGTAEMTFDGEAFCAEITSVKAPKPQDGRRIYIIDLKAKKPEMSVRFEMKIC